MDWTQAANIATNVANTVITPIQNRQMQKRQMEENERNRRFANEQQERQFQNEKQMLKEADSYKVQSLKNAGLNPALAYEGQAPVLTPSGGNAVEGKIAPQFDVGSKFQALGQAAVAYNQQELLQAQSKLTHEQAHKLELENANTENYNEVIAHRKEIIETGLFSNYVKNQGGIEAFAKIQDENIHEAEAKARKADAEFRTFFANLQKSDPNYAQSIIDKPTLENKETESRIGLQETASEKNKSETELNKAKTANVEVDTQLKKTEIGKVIAETGLIKAEQLLTAAKTFETWSRAGYLNKLMDKVGAEIDLIHSKQSNIDLHTNIDHFNNLQWLINEVNVLEAEGKPVPIQIKRAIAIDAIYTLGGDAKDIAKAGLTEYAKSYGSYKGNVDAFHSSHNVQPKDPIKPHPQNSGHPTKDPNVEGPLSVSPHAPFGVDEHGSIVDPDAIVQEMANQLLGEDE